MNDSLASQLAARTFARFACAAAPLALVLAACSSAPSGEASRTESVAAEGAELGFTGTLWSATQKRNLTYCIDRQAFSTHAYARLAAGLNRARAAWAKDVDVSFKYLPAEDGNCLGSANVVFGVTNTAHVHKENREDVDIVAFDPSTPAPLRGLEVKAASLEDDSVNVEQMMLHALGHILGFTHETDAVCNPSFAGPRMGPFDKASIMVGLDCPFAATSLSEKDIRSAQQLYGAPATACSRESKSVCSTFGATCEVAHDGGGTRANLCRWPATTPSTCTDANGNWMTAADAAKIGFPSIVPTGAACVRLAPAFRCPSAERTLCERHGAQCERTVDSTGVAGKICRWPGVTSADACHTLATGIWTPKGSSFETEWPHSVPNEPGACITQVSNLQCTGEERQLCETRGGLCEVAFDNGVKRDLCRWANVTTEAACRQTTDGRWIAQGSTWDDAVRDGRDGACVAAFAELKNAPDRTPRVWEHGCTGKVAPADLKHFFFERKDANVRCEDHTRGITTAWKVSDAVRGYTHGVCIATWTGTSPMVAADRDLLESWTREYAGNGIYPLCATTSPACTRATCPPVAPTMDSNGNPGKAIEISSGCPKCGIFEDQTLFAVRDPVRANEEQVVVPFSHRTTAVMVLPADGQQIVEVHLTPEQYAALGSPKDGEQAFVMTREELKPYSDAHFPPPTVHSP